MPHRYAFANTNKLDTVYNANNRSWQGIHNAITTEKNMDLFETDLIVQGNGVNTDSTRITIQVNKNCMTELLLLDNTKVLSLIDTGSNVNLISESVIKSSEYLSSLPILNCPEYRIRNTSGEMVANKFIELCFRVKDEYILHTTALVVPDFRSVNFLLSISSMNQPNSVVDVSSRQISIQKKSFVFKSCFHNIIKAHDTLTIGIKCILPKELRNGDFIAKLFRPFTSYVPLNFMLQFRKGQSLLKISHPTSNGLTIKADTALCCVAFELVQNLSQCSNTVTHLHQDIDGSNAMCSLKMSDCPIHQSMGKDPDIAHSHTCHDLYNHTPQSHDFPTCADSMHMSKSNAYHNNHGRRYKNQFNDHQYENMMRDYYKHNQDMITSDEIRELKIKTFPYLSIDDVRLSMSDRNIVRKELDLNTDSVLHDNDKQSIRDFFYSMRECLSTHDTLAFRTRHNCL